jgi:hypothetical protein
MRACTSEIRLDVLDSLLDYLLKIIVLDLEIQIKIHGIKSENIITGQKKQDKGIEITTTNWTTAYLPLL